MTSLYNRGMPLLRYRVGDVARLSDRDCPCGRGLPLMEPCLGRLVDYVELANGVTVSPYSLTCAIEEADGFAQFQIVQTSPDRVLVKVVPRPGFDDSHRRRIQQVLSPVLGGLVPEVESVPAILAEESGKYRVVVSRIGRGAGDEE